ncbi:MAG: HigA family addiction module antidote protein [Verrucomicrobia bacterium]|nr:HigA family addiction module antidote protein [Verrucomicrobiota bacterium]
MKMVRIPTHRQPTHAGEMLLKEFLEPMHLSQRDVADRIGVPYQRINELVNGRRGVTPSTALRLGKFLGTTPDFWMNLQQRWDLFQAIQNELEAIKRIQPVHAA